MAKAVRVRVSPSAPRICPGRPWRGKDPQEKASKKPICVSAYGLCRQADAQAINGLGICQSRLSGNAPCLPFCPCGSIFQAASLSGSHRRGPRPETAGRVPEAATPWRKVGSFSLVSPGSMKVNNRLFQRYPLPPWAGLLGHGCSCVLVSHGYINNKIAKRRICGPCGRQGLERRRREV